MNEGPLDLSRFFPLEDHLPRPQWGPIAEWVANHIPPEQHHAVWTDLACQWLAELGRALKGDYKVASSEHFCMLAPSHLVAADWLACAESYHDTLLESLPGIAAFAVPGKAVMIVFDSWGSYHQYWDFYDRQNSSEESLQNRYNHVAFCWRQPLSLQSILAHELTLHALCHLSHPQWIFAGLLQTFECYLDQRRPSLVTEALAQKHRSYWSRHGLKGFWNGDDFSRGGEEGSLCWDLAAILMELLSMDHRPRWFGLDRRRQQRFLAFLKEACWSDCGESAARTHLGFTLGHLAGQFLGPGDWAPPGSP